MDRQFGRTRFRDFTHAQLVAMLAAGRTAEVGAAADGWRELANILDDVAMVLERQNTDFQGLWDGTAADAHAAMVRALVDGVRRVAWAFRRIGDQVSAAGQALRRAQERMAALGPPLEVRGPDQDVLAAAAAPLPHGPARVEAAARQAAAIRAIQDFQRGPAAAAALAEAAAVVMDELCAEYLNVEFPPLPAIAEPPTVAPDGTPIFAPEPAPGAASGSRPLFADLWPSGLNAAAGLPPAQLLRAYQPVPPGAPVLPAPPTFVDEAGSNVDGSARPIGVAPGLPVFPGLDADAGRVVGQSSLAPTLNPAAVATGGAAVGAGLVPPFLGGGFAPPMGGGGDLGGLGRGAAAWLIGEVEEFGVRTPVVPPVVD